jgi:cytochrome c peroxidase
MRGVLKRTLAMTVMLVGAGCAADIAEDPEISLSEQELSCSLPNNHPVKNEHGKAAAFSTQGFIDQCSAFFEPQGTNGRDCIGCHAAESGWTMSSKAVQRVFKESKGLAPIFNALDADRNGADPVGTVQERKHAYSMLLKGKFTRNITPSATAEFEVIEASDPFGLGSTTRLWFFRRALPSVNFRNHTVMWDGANTVGTDLHAGLVKQASGNITGAQQGTPPADPVIVEEIVQFEMALSHAQLILDGVGRLDADGARGGPEHLSAQPLVAGRFDLYDAWIGSPNKKRAQIARGQELFNATNPGGGSCNGCHSAANDGQNANGILFNVGASRPDFAEADMAVYTLRNKTTGEILQTTDGGRGWRTGRWADLNRFKSPSLRGVSTRGEYFHNGIAKSLEDLVRFYETSLGFVFTSNERKDMVAFLRAL